MSLQTGPYTLTPREQVRATKGRPIHEEESPDSNRGGTQVIFGADGSHSAHRAPGSPEYATSTALPSESGPLPTVRPVDHCVGDTQAVSGPPLDEVPLSLESAWRPLGLRPPRLPGCCMNVAASTHSQCVC